MKFALLTLCVALVGCSFETTQEQLKKQDEFTTREAIRVQRECLNGGVIKYQYEVFRDTTYIRSFTVECK